VFTYLQKKALYKQKIKDSKGRKTIHHAEDWTSEAKNKYKGGGFPRDQKSQATRKVFTIS